MQTIFGKNLKKLRKEKSLLQKELAEDFNLSVSTISGWEIGLCMPTAAKLNDIAAYFEISTDELLGMEPIKKEPFHLNEEESRLLQIYRNASDSEKNVILTVLEHFDNNQDNISKKA